MWEEFISLFTGMDVIPALLLLIGLVLCIIECFTPGFGIFGVVGSVCVLAGIIVLIASGISLAQFFIMLFIIVVVLLAVFFIAVQSAKSGFISKSPLVTSGTAVSEDYGSPERNFGKLLGKEGILTCDCRPVGKAKIENEIYEVTSENEYLAAGKRVRVIEVEGAKIKIQAV